MHSPAASSIPMPTVRDPPPTAFLLTVVTHTLLLRMINQYNTMIQDPEDPGDMSDYRQFISTSRDAKNGWLNRSKSSLSLDGVVRQTEKGGREEVGLVTGCLG